MWLGHFDSASKKDALGMEVEVAEASALPDPVT